MSEKPLKLVNIDDMSRHVEAVMRRATTHLPKSLITQTGGMLRYCLRQHIAGNPAHPGMAKIAKMGKCSERQAQRNMRVLEAWGVFCITAYGKGGRWAPRYWTDLDAMKRALISLGCNPSIDIVEKMELIRGDIWQDIRGDIRRDIRRDAMSPGIQIDYPCQKSRPN
jgi:hypothetical protein